MPGAPRRARKRTSQTMWIAGVPAPWAHRSKPLRQDHGQGAVDWAWVKILERNCVVKIFVYCPASLATGGTELLHQLVHECRRMGLDAYIDYVGGLGAAGRPPKFAHYDAPYSAAEDRDGDVIVVPEVFTPLVSRINRAKTYVWWLSVDNYYRRRGDGKFSDMARSVASLLSGRRSSIRSLRRHQHLVQSHYAAEFLSEKGLASRFLGDFIGEEYLAPWVPQGARKDLILFNPKKGWRITRELLRGLQGIGVVPLSGMSSSELRGHFRTAKLYIDFGHHPGMDRLPREAAISGCCVVTGRRGAAANSLDIPIPERFKIDERSIAQARRRFTEVVADIFSNFNARSEEFEPYRMRIRGERERMRSEMAEIFNAR